MLASNRPASAALASPSLALSLPSIEAHPSSSVIPLPAYNQGDGNRGNNETMCQAADDFPSNFSHGTEAHIDAISLLSNGGTSKGFLTLNKPTEPNSGLDCVQCIEVFPDSMNHCVPEWDVATGKEMDILWEPTDLFLPTKGKWDSGQTKKSDLGFVPELDFEELCWEDGQLLVVMHGSNGRGIDKNRSSSQLNTSEPITGTVDPLGTADLVESSSVNMHTQEDELFSWLQHPPEELVDRHQSPSDMPMPSTNLADGERIYSSDLTDKGFRQKLGPQKGRDSGSDPEFTKTDTFATFSPSMGNKTGHRNINQQIEASVPNATTLNKELCEPCLPLTARVEMPTQSLQRQPASNSMPRATSLPNASKSSMNFSNFSRPAVAFKANLHSLGIANGLSGAERLKQLDKVAADVFKSESIDSTTKYLKHMAPHREEAAQPAVLSLSKSVGASFLQNPKQSFVPDREAKQNASAACVGKNLAQNASLQKQLDSDVSDTRVLNTTSGMGTESDGWKSSFIGSAAPGVDGNTQLLEFPEPSEVSSSGGSEDSDGVDGKRAAGTGKRKNYDEDSEIQSEALENEATGSQKQTSAAGNNMKRSKAAENHNQSERRRRDRISEKMKVLQSLVPNSHKTDKASMLEEAITYIKALKSQIQMMSCRGGMYFSPVFLPHGVQHVQMTSWPPMNMGIGMSMGMGLSTGMGMFDMNTVMATAAARPFSPMMSFPTTVIPAVQTTASAALDSAHMTGGAASSQVVSVPANQIMVPVRPAAPISGLCDSSPVLNGVFPQSCPISQQGQQIQIAPIGVKGNPVHSQKCFESTNFTSGFA